MQAWRRLGMPHNGITRPVTPPLNISVVYGQLITHPEWHARFVAPPPLTFAQVVHGLWVEFLWIFSQAFLFALSFTCFAFALSAFR